MNEVDNRPVKVKMNEYRFYFFFPTAGNMKLYDSIETIESIVKRADPDEREELASWAERARPGDWKRVQKDYALVICHRAKGQGTKLTTNVYPDEEGYDDVP